MKKIPTAELINSTYDTASTSPKFLPPLEQSIENISNISQDNLEDATSRRKLKKSNRPTPFPIHIRPLVLPTTPTNSGNETPTAAKQMKVGRYVLNSQRFITESARTARTFRPLANDLVTVRQLGYGAGGNVKLVKNRANQKLYAVKAMRSSDDVREVEHEVRTVDLQKHPNLVRTLNAFVKDNSVNVVQEYADIGNLSELTRSRHPLPQWVIRCIAKQILEGLAFLHSSDHVKGSTVPSTARPPGYLHRDMKPDNILVNSKGEVKLADFGLMTERKSAGTSSFVGTSIYMSPERLSGGNYNEKTDIWGYGLTILELCIGRPFFKDVGKCFLDLMVSVTSFNPLTDIPEDIPEKCRDHIAMCLTQDCEMRSTANELLSHDWINEEPVNIDDFANWLAESPIEV